MLLELIKSLFTPKAPAVHVSTNALNPQRLIDEAEKDWGAKFDPDPRAVHLIYREGANSDGTLNDNERDGWNDQRCLVQFVERRSRLIFNCVATTTPGYYYDVAHVIGWNGQGAALIALGQQACCKMGVHHAGRAGAHEALVQTGGECAVYRDFDRSFRRQEGYKFSGWYGINHHSVGPGRHADPYTVGPYSAGCLVAFDHQRHEHCMRLLKQDYRYVANREHVFASTVLPRPAR